MKSSTYTRYELLRNFRNVRFFVLSLAFPVVLYLAVAGSQRHATFDGIAFPLYFMTAMATLGTMAAVISSGARIATERSVGMDAPAADHAAEGRAPTSGPRSSAAT